MTKNAYVARKITVEGGGQQWRPFVHVRDVAESVRCVLESKLGVLANRVLNVGSSANNVRIKNLAYRVRDLVPGTEIVMAPTDPDLRDYNVGFDRVGRQRFSPEPHHRGRHQRGPAALREGGRRTIADGTRCASTSFSPTSTNFQRRRHGGRVLS
jgi:nucleoside-diphosphate-sugar epimerase